MEYVNFKLECFKNTHNKNKKSHQTVIIKEITVNTNLIQIITI